LLIWIVHYPRSSLLCHIFGISESVISQLISKSLPVLRDHFVSYIPHNIEQSELRSFLSPKILGVIDGTVHRIRRPQSDQYRTWNEHYNFHSTQSLIVADFTGKIHTVVTNLDGFTHDSKSATFSPSIEKAIGKNFVIGDTGFQGVPYVVAGLKSNQIHDDAEREFDKISRSEQVIIEHINNFIKKCTTINKCDVFIHSREHLAACVFICCGLYNWLLENFGKGDYL